MRRNTIFAVYTIYRWYEYLVSDEPGLAHMFLVVESHATCKRNAYATAAAAAVEPSPFQFPATVRSTTPSPNVDLSYED